MIDEYQVDEALAHGADTVLLMVPWGKKQSPEKISGDMENCWELWCIWWEIYIYIKTYTYICVYIHIFSCIQASWASEMKPPCQFEVTLKYSRSQAFVNTDVRQVNSYKFESKSKRCPYLKRP